MTEGVLEKGIKIVGVFLKILWAESEERFENVESSQVWRYILILEESVNVFFEFWPISWLSSNDTTSDFSQSISNVSLHAEISFFVNDFKELDFNEFLSGGCQLWPNICVRWWTKVGQTESDLRSWEVSEFTWVLT